VIQVEKSIDDDNIPAPICIGGERACPPEDIGGAWAYTDALQTLSNPDDQNYPDVRDWLGDFDPELFDLAAVNEELHRIFRAAPRNNAV
jgi:hypothetical protein